jgi:MFS family permease
MPPDQTAVSMPPVSLKKGWLNRNVFGLGLGSLFGDWNYEMASAVLPLFLSSVLHAPPAALGIIEGVADGVSTFFEVLAGWYSDRIGRRKGITAFGYFIIGLSKASIALAATWWHVLISRTTAWIGWSVKTPPRDALLVESTQPETVGRVFAFHRTMDTLGAIAGPLTATFLLAHVSVRTIFALCLIPGLCAPLSIWLLVAEKPRAPQAKNPWQSLSSLPRDFMKFLVPVGLFGISNFAPTLLILRAENLLEPTRGAISAGTLAVGLYTLSNIVYALVSYPIGVLSDRYSKKAILSAGYLLFGLLCFGFIFVGGQLPSLALLFALSGIYTAIIESSQPALASTLIDENQHGTGFGLMSAVDGVGDFFSSIIVGLLWTYLAPGAGFMFGALLAFCAAAILSAIRLDKR